MAALSLIRTEGREHRRPPIFWRVFLPNLVALIVAVLILGLTPLHITFGGFLELAAVAIGLLVILAATSFATQRALRPLQRLAAEMGNVDLLRPGRRVVPTGGSAEVAELVEGFDRMLERLETERREGAQRMIMAQEAERRRLAQELHDEIGQSLTALMLQIGELARRADAPLSGELTEAQEAVRDATERMAKVVHQLRPEALDDLGLASALVALGQGVAERGNLRLKRRLEEPPGGLGSRAELVIYRVAQEGLTNVLRHSGASEVTITLRNMPDAVELIVADNGRGFDGGVREGNGIRGMRERANLVGARLTVGTAPGGGAEVRLRLPLSREPSPGEPAGELAAR